MILGRMLRPKSCLFHSRTRALPEPDSSITGRLTGDQKSGKDAAAGVILTRKTWLPARGGVCLDLKEAFA
jgi:hypothetical protein